MATAVIRKLMDNVFTQRELFWLDDILPGKSVHRSEKSHNDEENQKLNNSNNYFFRRHHDRHRSENRMKSYSFLSNMSSGIGLKDLTTLSNKSSDNQINNKNNQITQTQLNNTNDSLKFVSAC
jgi:hypothetical protein